MLVNRIFLSLNLNHALLIIHSILGGQGSKLQSSGSFNVQMYLLKVVPFLLVPFFLCLKSELCPYFQCQCRGLVLAMRTQSENEKSMVQVLITSVLLCLQPNLG